MDRAFNWANTKNTGSKKPPTPIFHPAIIVIPFWM